MSAMLVLSQYLFYKTGYAKWIYTFFAITFISQLGHRHRNNKLRQLFPAKDALAIRVIENAIVACPFILFLVYRSEYLLSAGLTLAALLMALIRINYNLGKALPTPFRKYPFENIVGFRKNVLVIGLLYFLICKAVQVDNYNLGAVSLGAIFLLMMSFHWAPEQKYYVWLHNDNPQRFLRRKILTSIICSIILIAPAFILLSFSFSDRILISLLIIAVGIIFLSSMILAKYSAYPNEINLPQAILYGLSLWLPPMLLVVIPVFYKQSVRKLNQILR